MHCSKCGENIPTAAKFCPSCGEPISVNTSSHMSCKNCGASLEIDDKSIVFCPYCGSKEIIIDSDDVKIQKIDLEKEKAKLDFELTRQKTDEKNKIVDVFMLIFVEIIGMLMLYILYKVLW